jgi:hypothetical protein
MCQSYLIILLIVSWTAAAHSHGNEVHPQKIQKKIHLDEDGFEVINSGPTKITLEKINVQYQKNIRPVFLNKCLSCHGKVTDYPWYHSLPGIKKLIDYDVSEAKKHMDMTNDFPFGGHGSAKDDLVALRRTIQKKDMPPLRYLMLHWDSRLNKMEIMAVNKWINDSIKVLKK